MSSDHLSQFHLPPPSECLRPEQDSQARHEPRRDPAQDPQNGGGAQIPLHSRIRAAGPAQKSRVSVTDAVRDLVDLCPTRHWPRANRTRSPDPGEPRRSAQNANSAIFPNQGLVHASQGLRVTRGRDAGSSTQAECDRLGDPDAIHASRHDASGIACTLTRWVKAGNVQALAI